MACSLRSSRGCADCPHVPDRSACQPRPRLRKPRAGATTGLTPCSRHDDTHPKINTTTQRSTQSTTRGFGSDYCPKDNYLPVDVGTDAVRPTARVRAKFARPQCRADARVQMARPAVSNCSSATPAMSSACSPPGSATSTKPWSALRALLGIRTSQRLPRPGHPTRPHQHRARRSDPAAMAQARQLSELIRSEYLSFAATGGPGWTRYEPHGRATRVYDTTSTVVRYLKNAHARSGVTNDSASWTCPVDSRIAPA